MNFVKLNKTLENIVKISKKNVWNFVIENSDRIFYHMYFRVNYALLLLLILLEIVCVVMVVFLKYKEKSKNEMYWRNIVAWK